MAKQRNGKIWPAGILTAIRKGLAHGGSSLQHQGREYVMTKQTIVATAATMFAACTIVSSVHAADVRCGGINACKGQSACQTASSSCKGQNACKGQGWTEAGTASECTSKGGNVL